MKASDLLPLRVALCSLLFLLSSWASDVASAQTTNQADPHAELRAGDEAFGRKDFGAAELHYRRADERAPSFKSAYNLGVTLGYLDRPKEAAVAFQRARELAATERERGNAGFNGGTAHLGEQNLQAAVEDYAAALQARPDDEEARYNLSHALRQLRREEQQQQQQQQQPQQQSQPQQGDPSPDQQPPPQDPGKEENPDQQPQPSPQKADSPASPPPSGQDADDPQEPEDDAEPPKEPGDPSQGQPDPNAIPDDEAERLLRIAADQERRTNEKIRLGDRERPSSGKDW